MTFPNMAEAFSGWTDAIQFSVIKKNIADFEVVESSLDVIVFEGQLEPLKPQEILVKPEGQRSWKWWTLWTESELNLDDVVQDDSGKQYRVMAVQDWHNANYFEYQLVQAPPEGFL